MYWFISCGLSMRYVSREWRGIHVRRVPAGDTDRCLAAAKQTNSLQHELIGSPAHRCDGGAIDRHCHLDDGVIGKHRKNRLICILVRDAEDLAIRRWRRLRYASSAGRRWRQRVTTSLNSAFPSVLPLLLQMANHGPVGVVVGANLYDNQHFDRVTARQRTACRKHRQPQCHAKR